jgi:hypothetical protein
MINCLIDVILILTPSKFGNYIILQLLKLDDLDYEIILRILEKIIDQIPNYSITKYSSYIVKVVLCKANDVQIKLILGKFLTCKNPTLKEIVFNKYGKYVIGHVIDKLQIKNDQEFDCCFIDEKTLFESKLKDYNSLPYNE